MSDLAGQPALSRTSPQLPVDWYFDPQVYALEQRKLFERGPGYVGHELLVPNVGDYHVLERIGNAKALVHHADGVTYAGPECPRCNLSDAGRRGRAEQDATQLRW